MMHVQKNGMYEVNCKIQFTKNVLRRDLENFLQKYRTHSNFLYMRKLILILEFDLELCPLEWNHANIYYA